MADGRRVAGFILAVLCAGCVSRAPAPRPNILLVTLDTTRADHIGAYGDGLARTPNLDRLATGGVLFEHAVSAAPTTLPAHASLLTGAYPFVHGVRNNGNFTLGAGVPTLATVTHDAGYRTGAFVSAFVLDRRYGLGRGFDVYDDRFDVERRGDATVRAAGEWLAGGAGDARPFFLWVHLFDPHDPYDPLPRLKEAFPDRPYDAEIAAADEAVGTLLDRLRTLRLADTTVVAVAGDHGESLGEHGEATHGMFVYDAVMRVPMIVSAPGRLRGGARVTALVRSIDLAPTLLAQARLTLPGVEGRDLTALAGDPRNTTLGPGTAYGETYFPRLFMNWSELRSIRDERWKFIEAPTPELYDLDGDPRETTNLAAREPARTAAFVRALKDLGAQGAIAPSPVDRETARKLAALGYIGGAVDTPRAGAAIRPDPKAMIGVFNRLREANTAIRQGRFAEAEGAALSVLDADKDNAFARMVAGRAQLEQGRYREAVASYRAYAGQVPTSADAHHWIAVCHSRMGNIEAALDEEELALSIDPRHAEAHALRGGLLAERGRIDLAIDDLRAAVDAASDNVGFRVGLARLLIRGGRLSDADSELRFVLAHFPDQPDARAARGALLLARGEVVESVADFELSLRVRPDADDVRLDYADALAKSGRRDEARRQYTALAEGRETPPDIRHAARERLR